MKKKKKMKRFFLSSLVCLAVFSCQKKPTEQANQDVEKHVMQKEDQEKLTPDAVIENLVAGNDDFMHNHLTRQNIPERVKESALGQYPEAVVLSCIDSRVPVEELFNKDIGDLFVVRVAGNIVSTDVLGSLEYACKVAGSKVVLVLGHEHCGAIKSSIKGVKLGNITPILEQIEPAIAQANKTFSGDKNVANPSYVDNVCRLNVEHSITKIREGSPILNEMEKNKEIKIVGGVYDMREGKVTFF